MENVALLRCAFQVFMPAAIMSVAILGAAQTTTVSDFHKLGEETLERFNTADLTIGVADVNNIWDFSNVEIRGRDEVNISKSGVHSFCALNNHTSYKLSTIGDTLFWNGFENRLTNIRNPRGAIMMIYPFCLGDSIEDDYCFIGRYSKRTSYIEAGSVYHKADAFGSVVFPFDTLKNVLRVKSVFKYVMLIADSVNIAILEASRDSLLHIETISYKWYSDRYRYPVAERTDYSIYCQGKMAGSTSRSFVNESAYFAENSEKSNSIERMKSKGEELRVFVNSDGSRNIYVKYSMAHGYQNVEIMVCDIYGRVFFTESRGYIPAGTYGTTIRLDNANFGKYLLVVGSNGDIIEKQLINLKQ